MKTCTKCHQEKELTEFNRKGEGYQPKCRECQKAWYKNYYDTDPKEKVRILKKNVERRSDRIEYIRSFKNKPCTDCGEIYPHYVMQFDHIGTDKLYNIADMRYHSREQIDIEIAKCELVCANCHAERTWVRGHSL